MKPALQIKKIGVGTDDYALEIALRDRVLRAPLGLTIDLKSLDREGDDYHLGAFNGDELIGCLIITRIDKSVAKMRQVAVDQKVQGLRVGQALVKVSEELALAEGFLKIELSARDTAIGFYLKLGYEIEGEPFYEVTIPHRKMFKRLA